MGSANSHEIRQIVDEAVVALRSGQQQQSFRNHCPGEVISLDEDDGSVLAGEGDDWAIYGTDDVGVWELGYDSASDGPVCGGDRCSDSEWSECCYETAGCCVGGGGREKGRESRHGRHDVKAKKEKTCKECEKKQMCRKYPKKWSFKFDNRSGRPMSRGTTAGHLCGGAGSCGDVRPSPAGTGRRHAARHRTERGRCGGVLGDADESQPRRGWRRTLLFEEFDASPPGASGRMSPGDGHRGELVHD
ncbi:hypothetical protein LZ31DRAFT_628194 [Colletotrichum somersetense]|nr:hypothetical protein LZ31DRAFT_628194 [Colletotrichum somersetense]